MAKQYIYIPVNSDEMNDFATKIASAMNIPKNQILANKVTSGCGKAMYRWIDKCLSKLAANDTLYIVAHGAGEADSQKIGAQRNQSGNKQKLVYERGLPSWQGGVMKTYTPEHLSGTLNKEGLPSTFVNLHMFACGSGLAGTLPAWAKRLKDAMVQTHPSIQVTGYTGDISVGPSDVTIQSGASFYPLQQRAVTF